MASEFDDDFDSGDDLVGVDGAAGADAEASASGDSASSAIAIDYSLSSKDKERAELDRQVEEFLARGGQISRVDTQLCAEPPQKPSNAYGSRPI